MGNTALLGRFLFAFLFIACGAQKLASFNLTKGGPAMDIMEPKLDHFIDSLRTLTGAEIDVPKEFYIYLLGAAIFLELAGGVLFLMGSKFGAGLLVIFVTAVTPIIHNFWAMSEGSSEYIAEMNMFFKNVALLGALLFFIGNRPAKLKRA